MSPNLAGPLMPPGPVGVRTRTRSQHTMLFMTCHMARCGVAALLPGGKWKAAYGRYDICKCSASLHNPLKSAAEPWRGTQQRQGRHQEEDALHGVSSLPRRGAAAAGQRLEAHCTTSGDMTCRTMTRVRQSSLRHSHTGDVRLRARAQRTSVPRHTRSDDAQERRLLRVAAAREQGLHKKFAAARLALQDGQIGVEVTAAWRGAIKVAQAEAPPAQHAESRAVTTLG